MKHTRWITWVLVLVLALGLLPMAAFASDLKLPEPFGSQALTTRVNPLYQDVLKPEDLGLDNRPGRPPADAQPMATNYVTIAQAAVQMRQQMKNRATSFTLYIASDSTDYEAIIEEVLLQALVHTGKPKEGDYLMWHYAGFGGSVERASSGGQYRYTYNLEMAYYTTAAQESQLDTAVSNLLRSLNLSGKSNYQKVKAVYDYICKNVTYDEANLNNDSYTLKFSAYAALVNKTAVCQGYASLFYRLMLELGIDARVISGDGGGPHGWNIVKLGNVYYNVDTTWDAGMTEYQFFLRDTENFLGHARYLEYMSTQFHTDYPMAEDDYVDGVAGVPEHYFVMGTCGDDAYWAVSRDRQLTIVGEGNTYSFSRYGDLEDLSPWTYWTDGFQTVVIGEGITSIGDAMFFNMDNVSSVTLPDTLTTIRSFAFKYCDNLKQLTLPEGLLNIGSRAIYQTGLESITIPNSVTSMSSEAFGLNTNLREVTLGTGLMSGCSQAFWGCYALEKVTMPEGLSYLGDYMFDECRALEEIALPSTLSKIGPYTFRKTGIKSLVIPDTITELGNYAFANCVNLTSVVYGTGMTTTGEYAFMDCTALSSVTLSDTITRIGGKTFSGCSALKHIELGDSVQKVDTGAFEGTGLTEIELPEGLTYIGEDAFRGCGFTEVTIPSSVTYLSGFADCKKLKQVHFPDSHVETIGTGAFYNCESLEEFEVPAPVVSITGFNGCKNLKRVTFLGANLETIGSYAFANCAALKDLELPASVITIDAYAFKACSSLETLVIPESVTTINRRVFEECTGLKTIVIPENVTTFLGRFTDCTSLESVSLNYRGEIPGYCFVGCTALKNVHISDNITGIGAYTFENCTALETISISRGVESLSVGMFIGCTNLREIHFEGEAPSFYSDSFSGVTATAYYPGELHSWTDEVLQNYGGNITWVSTHIHTFESVVTPPTCTEQGYTTYTCTDCGRVKTGDYVSALGHRLGSWEVTLEPDCVSSGQEQAVCQVCDHVETRPLLPLGHDFRDGFCSRCGTEQPKLESVIRIAGADRIETSLMLADQLKEVLGVEKFNAVIVSSALNFPDALTGSYLAAVKDAPILLTYDMSHEKVLAYIEANLAPGGTVYILGGESAVSAAFENMAKAAGLNTKRVAGSDRFATNLAIMEEAGIRADQPILIATAVNFADSLSASAAGLPMVLVHGSLREDQKAFLNTTSGEFIIIGGTAAVSEELEAELAAIGTVERLAGDSRYQTSVLVAQKFLAAPEAVILAYARNFPDGLCGGPVAYALGAPLILTDNILPLEADAYVDGMEAGIVVGGGGLISDETAREIFELAVDMPIE